jgi:hypothetical protein
LPLSFSFSFSLPISPPAFAFSFELPFSFAFRLLLLEPFAFEFALPALLLFALPFEFPFAESSMSASPLSFAFAAPLPFVFEFPPAELALARLFSESTRPPKSRERSGQPAARTETTNTSAIPLIVRIEQAPFLRAQRMRFHFSQLPHQRSRAGGRKYAERENLRAVPGRAIA